MKDFPLPIWFYRDGRETEKRLYLLCDAAKHANEAPVENLNGFHYRHGVWKYDNGHEVHWRYGVMVGQSFNEYLEGAAIKTDTNTSMREYLELNEEINIATQCLKGLLDKQRVLEAQLK